MAISIEKYNGNHKDFLLALLSENNWPFHSKTNYLKTDVERLFEKGYFTQQGTQTFIIFSESHAKGVLRFFDLGESHSSTETPLFDIKISASSRNKGLGKQAVKLAVNWVFNHYPNKHRIEATTRFDNVAMQKVLLNLGFVKEAHYRQAWKLPNNNWCDCFGYALLKQDWAF